MEKAMQRVQAYRLQYIYLYRRLGEWGTVYSLCNMQNIAIYCSLPEANIAIYS